MTGVAERAAALVGGTLADARRLSGGSLSEVLQIALADGRVVIAKTGASVHAEAEMLAMIRVTGAPAPEVLGVADDLLVMAAVSADGHLAGAAWSRLAEALARLHGATGARYGWPHDHSFGRVAIANTRGDDWPSFWGEHRIACHVPHVAAEVGRRLARLVTRLSDHLPSRPPPALLHGDLWGGNVLVGASGDVTLIDPACYHGDREVDVAMLTLFNDPPASFFAALGLAAGWRARLPAYRLWPLLVHLRLFGSGYRAQVEEALTSLGA